MTNTLQRVEDFPMPSSQIEVFRRACFAASMLMGCGSITPPAAVEVKTPPAESESKPPVDAMEVDEDAPPPKLPRSPASQADLDALIAKSGSLTLRTYDGKWEGFDGDRDYTFFPNKVVTIQMYGLSDNLYRGTYRMDAKGRIEFDLKGKEWSPMLLQKDARSILMVYDNEDWSDQRPCRPIVPED